LRFFDLGHNDHPVDHNDRCLKFHRFSKIHWYDLRFLSNHENVFCYPAPLEYKISPWLLIPSSESWLRVIFWWYFQSDCLTPLKSYQYILLFSSKSVHNSPLYHNTIIRKSATGIILVGLSYEFDDLKISLNFDRSLWSTRWSLCPKLKELTRNELYLLIAEKKCTSSLFTTFTAGWSESWKSDLKIIFFRKNSKNQKNPTCLKMTKIFFYKMA
jgi:hypothetical protein